MLKPSMDEFGPVTADVSDAVRLAFLGAITLLFGVSYPLSRDLLLAGLSAGASAGRISLASSRTKTAPSSLLSFMTISCNP
jgi:hypothetical protein